MLCFQDAFIPTDSSSSRPDNCCESGIVSVWHNLNSDRRQVDCRCPCEEQSRSLSLARKHERVTCVSGQLKNE